MPVIQNIDGIGWLVAVQLSRATVIEVKKS